jgi:hypothetical protein
MAAEHGGPRETEGPEPGVAYPSLPRQLPTQPQPGLVDLVDHLRTIMIQIQPGGATSGRDCYAVTQSIHHRSHRAS